MDQVEKNTTYIKKCASFFGGQDFEINFAFKVALAVAGKQQCMDCSYSALPHLTTALSGIVDHDVGQDAEVASLNNTPDAFKLYDVAVKYVQ